MLIGWLMLGVEIFNLQIGDADDFIGRECDICKM